MQISATMVPLGEQQLYGSDNRTDDESQLRINGINNVLNIIFPNLIYIPIGSRKRKSQTICLPPLVPVAIHELVGSTQNVVITPCRSSVCCRQAISGIRRSQQLIVPYSVAYTTKLGDPLSKDCISTTGPCSVGYGLLSCIAIFDDVASIRAKLRLQSFPAITNERPASQTAIAYSGVFVVKMCRDLWKRNDY